MKRLILAIAVIGGLGFGTYAADNAPKMEKAPKKELTPEERAERRERFFKETGGVVTKAGDGKLLYVNCQDLIKGNVVTERVDRIRRLLRYTVELRNGEWKFGDARPSDATASVFVVNDPKLPMSLVAVEERWGVVNVANLKLGNRFSKELTRVTTLVLSAGRSQYPASPMQTVTKPSDLDLLLTDDFMMDSVNQIMANTKALGLTRYKKTSYKTACQEGWAAAPTNDFQKAIWELVHEPPKNPMKIEFDSKKGR